MKLKLEAQGAVTILTVSELVETKHLPVLRAGLGKLFQAGKSDLILDLTGTDPKSFESKETVAVILGLRAWASEQNCRIRIASRLPQLGDATHLSDLLVPQTPKAQPAPPPSAAPAPAKAAPIATPAPAATTAQLQVPKFREPEGLTPDALEEQLKKAVSALKARKDEASKLLEARSAESIEIKRLQKENAEMKTLIQLLEGEVAAHLKTRVEPVQSDANQAKLATARQVVDSVLQGTGILATK